MKSFFGQFNGLKHTIAVAYLAVFAAYTTDPTVHATLNTIGTSVYSALPHWAVLLVTGLVLPLLSYYHIGLKKPEGALTPSQLTRAAAAAVIVAAMFVGASCRAQTVSTAPASLPSSFYAVGPTYNPSASPQFAGTLLIAKNVSISGSNQLAFTVVDVVPVNLKTLTVSTNIGIGDAVRVATIAGHQVYAPTSAGISYTGSNTGWNWTTGVAVPFRIRANGWYAVPNVRVLKSSIAGGYQLAPGVLLGWGQ